VATTVKKIIEIKPNDYLGNDRTIFLDEGDREMYTFGKVSEGVSYEGSVSPDKRGLLQFKKTPKEGFTPPPVATASATVLTPPPPPQTASQATQRFETAVDKFVAAVNQLTLALDKKEPTVSDEDIARVEDFFESENA
jgi:hypothetical protein